MKIANLKIGTSILNIKSDFNRSYLSLNKTGYEIVFIIIFNIGVLISSTSGIVLLVLYFWYCTSVQALLLIKQNRSNAICQYLCLSTKDDILAWEPSFARKSDLQNMNTKLSPMKLYGMA